MKTVCDACALQPNALRETQLLRKTCRAGTAHADSFNDAAGATRALGELVTNRRPG
jgi:hypothetical protein